MSILCENVCISIGKRTKHSHSFYYTIDNVWMINDEHADINDNWAFDFFFLASFVFTTVSLSIIKCANQFQYILLLKYSCTRIEYNIFNHLICVYQAQLRQRHTINEASRNSIVELIITVRSDFNETAGHKIHKPSAFTSSFSIDCLPMEISIFDTIVYWFEMKKKNKIKLIIRENNKPNGEWSHRFQNA